MNSQYFWRPFYCIFLATINIFGLCFGPFFFFNSHACYIVIDLLCLSVSWSASLLSPPCPDQWGGSALCSSGSSTSLFYRENDHVDFYFGRETGLQKRNIYCTPHRIPTLVLISFVTFVLTTVQNLRRRRKRWKDRTMPPTGTLLLSLLFSYYSTSLNILNGYSFNVVVFIKIIVQLSRSKILLGYGNFESLFSCF